MPFFQIRNSQAYFFERLMTMYIFIPVESQVEAWRKKSMVVLNYFKFAAIHIHKCNRESCSIDVFSCRRTPPRDSHSWKCGFKCEKVSFTYIYFINIRDRESCRANMTKKRKKKTYNILILKSDKNT